MKRQRKSPSRSEAGFALLFVYAMAATVAIMLLLQIPSAAFEAQRNREQLLIDRGEQYSRAIQLYVRKLNRYPPDFDALESTQNLRFLRHRYEDPLTGKEEWRLIHVGPGGVFLDSLLNKKKDGAGQAAPQTFITEVPMVQDPTGALGGVNMATRRNPSGAYNPNDPNSPLPGQQNPLPGQSGYPSGYSGGQTTISGFPGTVLPGQSGQLPDPNQTQQIPGGLQSGTQLPPGIQMPGQNGSVPGSGAGGTATSMINQLLTTPRPGGLGGLGGVGGAGAPQPTVDAFGNPVQGATTAGTPTGQPVAGQAAAGTIGGGIAGIASKVEQEGIKRYRDRKLYNEWEFVYDVTKDTGRAGSPQQQQGGAAGTPGAPGAAAGATPAATTPASPAGATPPPPPPTTPPSTGSISSAGSTSGSISIFPSIGSAPLPAQPAQPAAPVQPISPVLPGQMPQTPAPGTPGAAPATPGLPPGLTLPPGMPVPGAPPPQQ